MSLQTTPKRATTSVPFLSRSSTQTRSKLAPSHLSPATHRRRNRWGGGGGGGSGGTCPHKLQVGGAVPPQPEPCQDAVLGLTMIHSMNIDSSRVHSTYNSFLHCYNQETLVYLSQVQTLASLDAKMGVVFTKYGRGPKIFTRAMCAINILCPHNAAVQHLPAPLLLYPLH